jgi:hypothetical protein
MSCLGVSVVPNGLYISKMVANNVITERAGYPMLKKTAGAVAKRDPKLLDATECVGIAGDKLSPSTLEFRLW